MKIFKRAIAFVLMLCIMLPGLSINASAASVNSATLFTPIVNQSSVTFKWGNMSSKYRGYVLQVSTSKAFTKNTLIN